jgi:DNA polymerase III subunit epsilon
MRSQLDVRPGGPCTGAPQASAAIELLATILPTSGETGLSRLLQAARRQTWRIWAEDSPFAAKDHLAARKPVEWRRRRNSARLVRRRRRREGGPEHAYLREEIYRREVNLRIQRVTAYERFSDRI